MSEKINEELVRQIITKVVSGYQEQNKVQAEEKPPVIKTVTCPVSEQDVEILVEASARHVHLTEEDIETLFGKGYKLTPVKKLTQVGQFACKERVTLIGPKNIYRNVAILGPARKETQVELSLTDARFLGVNAPVRMSGDLRDAADIIIATDKESIAAKGCAIVAQNHIHMTPDQAKQWCFTDGEEVSVKMSTARPLTFDGVVVRVSETAGLAMHIDFDEANACLFKDGDMGLIKRSRCGTTAQINLPKMKGEEKKLEMAVAINKRFITEEDIKKALKNVNYSGLTLPKAAILSAPAKDYINREKINITFI
ncbi:MAG: phosphate propanoyltransferase [Firmicutes bacterium]|nr:phosphate propanoyltransferase [Bacillota bacterium]MBQ6088892.1 phosphate propanoyltransferase [Bacillota bacterium]MBR3184041.1 phosphate propanoyltransferase [Bacillota bacterium]MBR3259881.1 phosphate propanoyltransferase [Bacillota bacterium]MBR3374683.1 phosphate propanoyltransferase [Bacillota bacterium]